jgi:hypothetical protein
MGAGPSELDRTDELAAVIVGSVIGGGLLVGALWRHIDRVTYAYHWCEHHIHYSASPFIPLGAAFTIATCVGLGFTLLVVELDKVNCPEGHPGKPLRCNEPNLIFAASKPERFVLSSGLTIGWILLAYSIRQIHDQVFSIVKDSNCLISSSYGAALLSLPFLLVAIWTPPQEDYLAKEPSEYSDRTLAQLVSVHSFLALFLCHAIFTTIMYHVTETPLVHQLKSKQVKTGLVVLASGFIACFCAMYKLTASDLGESAAISVAHGMGAVSNSSSAEAVEGSVTAGSTCSIVDACANTEYCNYDYASEGFCEGCGARGLGCSERGLGAAGEMDCEARCTGRLGSGDQGGESSGSSAGSSSSATRRRLDNTLVAMWKNPTKQAIKCSTYEHHWTSVALYVGVKGMAECDTGKEMQYECHGGGIAVGAYHYMEGYSGWNSLPSEGDEFSLVCSGIDLALIWDIGGPLHGCGMWKDGKQIGSYHGTWRGGGLDVRALLWGYKCKVKRVQDIIAPVAREGSVPPMNLPAMWKNPVKRAIKCRTYEHHWTSVALYVGVKGMSECDTGKEMQYECHGGGIAVGAYHYMEGYSGWNSLPSEGDEFSLVCSGIDLALVWDIGGPLHGCGMWKDGKQIGSYHGTWRGGGLDVRALLWGYKCKVTSSTNFVRDDSRVQRARDRDFAAASQWLTVLLLLLYVASYTMDLLEIHSSHHADHDPVAATTIEHVLAISREVTPSKKNLQQSLPIPEDILQQTLGTPSYHQLELEKAAGQPPLSSLLTAKHLNSNAKKMML